MHACTSAASQKLGLGGGLSTLAAASRRQEHAAGLATSARQGPKPLDAGLSKRTPGTWWAHLPTFVLFCKCSAAGWLGSCFHSTAARAAASQGPPESSTNHGKQQGCQVTTAQTCCKKNHQVTKTRIQTGITRHGHQ